MDIDAKMGQRSHIWRIERIERAIGAFDCPVASVQLVVEEHAHLGYAVSASHDEGAQKIVSAIRANLKDGDLRSRHDDGLAQIFQHKREGRGRIGKSVGPVQDDETIKELIGSLEIRNRGQTNMRNPKNRTGAVSTRHLYK